ncbi:nuclear transport factor 2 family protein [Microbacterium sp.]|uniref:nuclear transport factor 2 family protein n=1 Tax=Microbacterium sp. TaxID=51671 RepID=UPI002D7689F0|nr:nuclear transport factor 2 family protein [Microbacterium sp.]HET6301778.1 nuclear transport factor 2 family protein [Microbacterium sp.]
MDDREKTDAAARRWVERYVIAWRTNDPADIGALFTPDVEYRFEPWEEPIRGSEAITEEWIKRADEPGTYEFTWDVAGIDGSRAFIEAETRYKDGNHYRNMWVVDLADDGRARRFTEWWMKQRE